MKKWITYEEILAKMPEERRRKIKEGGKALIAEEDFWNSLPEAEKNKRLEKPKVAYDATSDALWMKNGRPTHRSHDILAGRVTVFFEADIWYPSALMVSKVSRFLSPIFGPDDTPRPESFIVRRRYGGEKVEKFLNLDGLEIDYENTGDYLWIGNGEDAWDGTEFAKDLIVFFAEDNQTPVGISLTPASKLLTPLLAPAWTHSSPNLL